MISKSFLLPVFLFISVSAFSNNYYFSESIGNDNWSGRLALPNANSTDGPRKSLNALNNLLNTTVRAGDSVFLKRGDLWSGTIGIATGAAQGNPNQHIFIGAYGMGNRPTIFKSGTGEILLCRGSANAAASYLHFKDLALISNSAIGSRPVGVYVNESFYSLKPHHIILNSLYISGCQNGMILYQNNISVENCMLEKNGNDAQGQGIFCSATDVQFKNNVLDSNGCGSVFVHSIYISQSKNILFEGNEIKNADDGLKLRASENLIIRNNRIHNTYIHTIHVGGDQSSGTKNVVIEGNHVYNAPQGLRISSESGTQTLLSENIIVRNNIFPAQVFISDNGPVKDIFFYNNIIHTGSNQPALFFTNAINPVNLQIKNNIFYKTTSNANHSLVYFNNGLNGISLDHNLYYFPASSNNLIYVSGTSYKTLTAFRSAYPASEIKGQNGDPNFVSPTSDFHLTANSLLAIDKGADMANVVTQDFDGMPRPIDGDGLGGPAWDIGPYEYCCIVNTKDYYNQNLICNIFPNPASTEIVIETEFTIPEIICIMDLFGNKILPIKECSKQSRVDISKLPSGIYFLQLDFKDGVILYRSFQKI
ncbi:MAG: right-handed parallel beta-helix repeat-containing protein [Saprospiraceae bacterium]|nr:right-handed parallel beta-helix repeat-containing protein [Saprospiraceae bacterium]